MLPHSPNGILAFLLACIGGHVLVAADNIVVTCGSTFKLHHLQSGFRLHSHEVAYSRGSGQQSVTTYPSSDDTQGHWILHGTTESPCPPGSTVKKNQLIRLQHATTRKWLHSHQFYSPLSGNLEVSAFGSDGQTDGGDLWRVEWDTKAKIWKQETKVRMKHVDTGAYLASIENARFGHPIAGQQEVAGVMQKSASAVWTAAEGVYLPRMEVEKETSETDKDEL